MSKITDSQRAALEHVAAHAPIWIFFGHRGDKKPITMTTMEALHKRGMFHVIETRAIFPRQDIPEYSMEQSLIELSHEGRVALANSQPWNL